MSEVTQAIEAMRQGDPEAAKRLVALVYSELHRVAAHLMLQEPPGNTLQPTALVHEAWLRLGADTPPSWVNRAHFFAAAAEAMRRILVERARRRHALRHGGGLARVNVDEVELVTEVGDDKLLQVHEVLDELEREDPLQAQVVKLRFFAGLSGGEVARALGVSERSVGRRWAHAKAWLYQHIDHRA
jgi:RNA polymerase sigma factor (TIGR02999 family)